MNYLYTHFIFLMKRYKYQIKNQFNISFCYRSGKGNFGDVFLARARGVRGALSPEQEMLVVVKSLLTTSDKDLRLFYQEMEMFGRVDHPNVVRLMGVCREMEPQFLITEYCDWVSEYVIQNLKFIFYSFF